jgi:hypothetical protein
MIDAYTHLDLTCADPIADMKARMAAAGIEGALAVETWKADNLSWLRQMMAEPSPQFRVALCFRPVLDQQFPGILENRSVIGLRVRTEDMAQLHDVAAWLQTLGKWLIPHAENGIGPLKKELLALAQRTPGLQIYLPHLGCLDFSPRVWKGGALQAAEKLESAVILRSSGDEESRIALKMLRARSFAALRMTAL